MKFDFIQLQKCHAPEHSCIGITKIETLLEIKSLHFQKWQKYLQLFGRFNSNIEDALVGKEKCIFHYGIIDASLAFEIHCDRPIYARVERLGFFGLGPKTSQFRLSCDGHMWND